MLADDPESYTVGNILRLTEGELTPVPCAGQDPVECDRCESCMTFPIWTGLDRAISGYLDGMTLQDVLDHYYEEVL